MGERIHPGDGERKVGVVLVGQTQADGLDAQAKADGVAVERCLSRGDGQRGSLDRIQDRLVDPTGPQSLADEFHHVPDRDHSDDLHRLGKQWPPNGYSRTELFERTVGHVLHAS